MKEAPGPPLAPPALSPSLPLPLAAAAAAAQGSPRSPPLPPPSAAAPAPPPGLQRAPRGAGGGSGGAAGTRVRSGTAASRRPPRRGAAAATTQCVLRRRRGGGGNGRAGTGRTAGPDPPLSPPRSAAAPPGRAGTPRSGCARAAPGGAGAPRLPMGLSGRPPSPPPVCSRGFGGTGRRGAPARLLSAPPPSPLGAGPRPPPVPLSPFPPTPPRHVCSALFGAALQRGFPRLLPLYSFMDFLPPSLPLAVPLAHTRGSPGPAVGCLPPRSPIFGWVRGDVTAAIAKARFSLSPPFFFFLFFFSCLSERGNDFWRGSWPVFPPWLSHGHLFPEGEGPAGERGSLVSLKRQ